MSRHPTAIAALLLTIVLTGCTGLSTSSSSPTAVPQPTSAPPSGERLTVYAAASLTEALKEIGGLYSEKTGQQVDFNFGASNMLRTQIEQGAVVDVFASANKKEMDSLVQAGLVDGDPSEFAKNRLVIVVPKDNPARILIPQDLARPGVKFVTAQPGAPVGQYTVTALEKMSAEAAFGSDFKSKVDANTVSKEENVRAVLGKVALGEADAGVVYVSDISSAQRSKVTTLEVPDQFNTIASYPISLVKGAPHPDQAREFLQLVLSPEGQAVLQKYNFIPARP
jgi:molybdate transport system substrate-binding protein